MSALRLALHYAPPHSHLYLFTDASIKDQELVDTVLTLALAKSVQVSKEGELWLYVAFTSCSGLVDTTVC